MFYFVCSFDYTFRMFIIKLPPEFSDWLDGLKDYDTRIRLAGRLDKVVRGQHRSLSMQPNFQEILQSKL